MRTIRAVAVVGMVAGACAAGATSAAAQSVVQVPLPVTTAPATVITATGATLNGSIKTGGEATYWSFEYASSPSNVKFSTGGATPSGEGTVDVSQRVSGLTPGTEYAFSLFAIPATTYSYGYYYSAPGAGQYVAFTTAPKPQLKTKTTKVNKGKIKFTIACVSHLPACHGAYTDSVRVRHKTIKLFNGKFNIKAGKQVKFTVKLSGSALLRVYLAKKRTLNTTFAVGVSGQRALRYTLKIRG